MDFGSLFRDGALRQEFLDRFGEISAASGGLEGLDGGLSADRAARAVSAMTEGSWRSGDDRGLEAIIQRCTRPVHLIQRATFDSAGDGFPRSEQVTARLDRARGALEAAIPSVGRIDLRNHDQLDWAGTGWMIGPGLAVTNRHVAREFTACRDGAFAFRVIAGRRAHAALDFLQEYGRPDEARFTVTAVAWSEPDESPFDVALLRVTGDGEDGRPAPPPIGLLDEDTAGAGRWVGVIGYPGYDSRADGADQQRVFSGIYGCKRLAAGQVLAADPGGLVAHDATTLGGSSGSAVIDLSTGRALALHFGGRARQRNHAVSARAVARIVRDHG